MTALLVVLVCLIALPTLALALLGLAVLVALARGNDHHGAHAHTSRAERRIVELGRELQLTILHDAVRRAGRQDGRPS